MTFFIEIKLFIFKFRYKELSKRSTLISSMQAETITELNETSNPHDDPNDSGQDPDDPLAVC